MLGEKRTCPNCGNYWSEGESLEPVNREPIFLKSQQRIDAGTMKRFFECDACHKNFSVTDNPSWEHAQYEVLGSDYQQPSSSRAAAE